MKRLLLTLPALAFAMSACGGGATQHVLPASSTTSANVAHGALALKLTMPKSNGATTQSLSRRNPAYISAQTASISLAFTPAGGTSSQQSFPVTPGSGDCPSSANIVTCTFTLSVPFTSTSALNGTLVIAALDASNTPLSSANVAVTVQPSGTTVISAVLGGIVQRLLLASPPSQTASAAAAIPVTLEALDPGGNLIVGPYSADALGTVFTVTLTSSDTAHEPLNVASVNDSSTSIAVNYDGMLPAGAGATISASGGSYTAQVALNYLNGKGAAYFVTLPASGNAQVVVMNGTSVVRTLTMSGRPSASSIAVAPNGTIYAQSGPASVDVFSPGATNATPIQTIVDPNFSASAPILALAGIRKNDNTKNGVLIGGGNTTLAQLDTYAPGATTPLSTATSTFGPVLSVASSSNGRFYALAANQSNAEPNLETYTGTPSSISGNLVNWDSVQATSFGNNYTSFTGYNNFWDQANSDCHIAVDDVDAQVIVGCWQQYTLFNAAGNGSATIVFGANTLPYTSFLAWAPPTVAASGGPFTLISNSVKTHGLSYDDFGNLASFDGSTLTEFNKTAVQGSTGNTLTANATIVPSGTALAAVVGP